MSSIKIALNESKGKEFIKSIEGKESLFILAIAYTETAEIDGITIAGANKDMIKYTPPADAEFLYSGICKCIDAIPATPDGKPTPALITRAALRLMDIPVYVIDSGSKVKPMIPHYTLAVRHGCNIAYGKALSIEDVNNAFY
jgi:NaMN:DMB phosphoribosyltransferase